MDLERRAIGVAGASHLVHLVFHGRSRATSGVRAEVSAYRVSDGPRPGPFPPSSFLGIAHRRGRLDLLTLDPKSARFRSGLAIRPDFNKSSGPGEPFTTGIVALDASSERLRWSYQNRPNDDHDWSATAARIRPGNGTSVLVAREGRPRTLRRFASGKLSDEEPQPDDRKRHRADHARRNALLSGCNRRLGVERRCVESANAARLM